MTKLTLFPTLYCIACFMGSFSNDVCGIGSSISLPVASASGIENAKSFSNDRTRRALALLVPFDDYDESAEEHHKSKRCFRAHPVRKTRLSIEPEDTENSINKESTRLAHGTKYNCKKLYDYEKRSAERSDEESLENGHSWEDNSEKKVPYLRIVPLKNPRTNLGEFFRTDDEAGDDNYDSEEYTEDLILKKIKNHLNSDDYNVLALVGKRASNSQPKRHAKYICYCREANCPGGNCRMTYRPCSRCKNSRPELVGKVNSNRCSDGRRNYVKNQEFQSTEARTPLTIQYPASRKETVEYPIMKLKETPRTSSSANPGVDKMDYTNFQLNLPSDSERYHISYNSPRVVPATPNTVNPSDQYRILHIPKSGMRSGSGIPSSNLPTNIYLPAAGKPVVNFRSNYSPYSQWVASSYHHPSIGSAGNSDIRSQNHRTNPQNFGNVHHGNNGFFGMDRGIEFIPQIGTPGYQSSQTFGGEQAKMDTNFHRKHQEADSLGRNMPNGVNAYFRQQHLQATIGDPDYQKKPELSPTQVSAELYGQKNHRIENSERTNSQFDFKAGGYDASTDKQFGSVSDLETNKYSNSDESQENNSMDSDYEDGIEEEIVNSEVSVGRNLANDEDQRNIGSIRVADGPKKYEMPIICGGKANPSDTLGAYENFESENSEIGAENSARVSQELHNNRNYLISGSTTNHAITGTENSNYGDQTVDAIHETAFRTQLEEPANELSNRDHHIDATITEPESNEDGYSLESESREDAELIAAERKHSDVKESAQISTSEATQSQKSNDDDYSDIQVITNGYFTSQAFDDFEDLDNDDITTTGIGRGSDLTQHEIDTHNSHLNDVKQMDSGLRDENFAKTTDAATTELHFEDRRHGLSGIDRLGHKTLDGLSLTPENQLLEDDVIVVSSASDEMKDPLVHSADSGKANVGCTCMKSNEFIETLAEPKKSSIEVVGRQETASEEYESAEDGYKMDSSNEEEVAKEAADGFPSFPAYRKELEDSYEDASYSENGSMEYSTENSADELVKTGNDHNLIDDDRDRVGDEPVDFIIDNSPTRYFSPNDRVLEYVKKHSQNLVADSHPGNYEQHRTQAAQIFPTTTGRETQYVTPTIYHKKNHRLESTDYEPYYHGFDSEEIITEPSNDWQDNSSENSNERTASDVTASQETSGQVDDPLIQEPRYGERDNMQLSNCGGYVAERQSTVFEKPGDENILGKSEELQKPINKPDIAEPRQSSTKLTNNLASDGNMRALEHYEDYSPEVIAREHDQIYHGNISEEEVDESDEEFRSPEVEVSEHDQIHHGNISEEEVDESDEEFRFPEVVAREHDQIYHGNISEEEVDESDEEFRSHEGSRSSEESGSTLEDESQLETYSDMKKIIVDNPVSLGTDRTTEITGMYRKYGEKIHHLGKSDGETSEVSMEHRGMKYPTRASGEIYSSGNYGSTEPNEESARKHMPIDISGDYYDSVEPTGDFMVVGKSQEQDVDLVDEKSETARIHKGFLPHTYDHADPTEGSRSAKESIESSTDISAKSLSAEKHWQYNERGNADSPRKTTSSYGHRVVGQKSEKEIHDNSKKLLDNFSSRSDNVDTFGSQEEHRTSNHDQIEESSLLEMNSGIEDLVKTPLNQNIGIENHGRQSTRQDSDIPNDDSGIRYAADTERRSEARDESTPKIETALGSGEAKNFEIVGGSQSTGCCTKPPEVEDDFGYLGRLKPKKTTPDVKSLGDLVDSDLYYIGDGVKLPLTIKRLKDGSFALSISDEICKKRSQEKCPCCVPREGRILQEKRGEEEAEESAEKNKSPSSLHRRAIPDDEKPEIGREELGDSKMLADKSEEITEMEDPELEVNQKTQDHGKRIARSISMPVDTFADKYNLILDLNDQITNDLEDVVTESSPKHNVIQRDETKQDLVEKLALIDEVSENEKEDVLLSTLQDLINTEPKEVFKQTLKSAEDREEDGQRAQYGYQKDNPILDRIKIIKELQKEANRCERKYQKDCDDAITRKTELLMIILNWLKDLIAGGPN